MNHQPNHIDYVKFPTSSVESLNQTRDFFTNVFGWNYAMYGDDYADTAESGVASGVNAENPSPAVLPVIYVADLEKTFEEVQAAGAQIIKEIYTFPGGRRFHFREPSGNEVAVWSE
jgi:predicted enzyme related to lactoylglutathione lyase